jgi:hypothetical protein
MQIRAVVHVAADEPEGVAANDREMVAGGGDEWRPSQAEPSGVVVVFDVKQL